MCLFVVWIVAGGSILYTKIIEYAKFSHETYKANFPQVIEFVVMKDTCRFPLKA